jgi:hypothetical protein
LLSYLSVTAIEGITFISPRDGIGAITVTVPKTTAASRSASQ